MKQSERFLIKSLMSGERKRLTAFARICAPSSIHRLPPKPKLNLPCFPHRQPHVTVRERSNVACTERHGEVKLMDWDLLSAVCSPSRPPLGGTWLPSWAAACCSLGSMW